MEEYENLKEMVRIETEEEEFYIRLRHHHEIFTYGELLATNFTWVKEPVSRKSRKGHYYKQVTDKNEID